MSGETPNGPIISSDRLFVEATKYCSAVFSSRTFVEIDPAGPPRVPTMTSKIASVGRRALLPAHADAARRPPRR